MGKKRRGKRGKRNKNMVAKQNNIGTTAAQRYSAAESAKTFWSPRQRPQPVMEIGRATLWAGAISMMDELLNPALLINLTEAQSTPGACRVNGNTTARATLPASLFTPEVPVLRVRWPDHGVVDLDYDWWMELIRYIETLPKGSRVGMGCWGGHGRTGTALSIIAALSGQSGEADPVEWVRKHYCDDAVESEAQVLYIERITGRMVHEMGSYEGWSWRAYADPKAGIEGGGFNAGKGAGSGAHVSTYNDPDDDFTPLPGEPYDAATDPDLPKAIDDADGYWVKDAADDAWVKYSADGEVLWDEALDGPYPKGTVLGPPGTPTTAE